MLQVSVRGGTRAGWRRVRDALSPWTCACGEFNPAHRVNCGGCKQPRPE